MEGSKHGYIFQDKQQIRQELICVLSNIDQPFTKIITNKVENKWLDENQHRDKTNS